jgi:hypothetical protein
VAPTHGAPSEAFHSHDRRSSDSVGKYATASLIADARP